jgi:hypothetical protein
MIHTDANILAQKIATVIDLLAIDIDERIIRRRVHLSFDLPRNLVNTFFDRSYVLREATQRIAACGL